MKKPSLAAKSHATKKASRNGAPKVDQAQRAELGSGSTGVWKRSLVVLCIVLTAGATYAVLHFVILSKIPHAMLGTWLVIDVKAKDGANADEALKGGRLEFRRDGTMIGKINMNGKEGTIKAAVSVEGEILRITSAHPQTGQTVTDVQTIRTLAGDQLVIEDHKGTVLMMERLRE